MNDVERDELEWELKQRNEVAEILARQLNEKIDECTILQNQLNGTERKMQLEQEVARDQLMELEQEVARLNDLILSMTKHIK